MTSRPRFAEDATFSRGLAAVALFVVMAAVFLTASFGAPAGFPTDASITATIGYALVGLPDLAGAPNESFLAAFELIDLVLVAALVGAVMLARRDDGSILPLKRGDE